ncbi:MAG: HNH endonuclease [Bryobacteraceae bacterium]
MPAIPLDELIQAILDAIQESGYSGQLASPVRKHPRRFLITLPVGHAVLSVYAWTLTFGGRPTLRDEYRIQMTSVQSPLQIARDGPTVLMGYEPNLRLFAGFDLNRHRRFTTGSPSIQIDIGALRQAEMTGLSFHRKANDEIAVGLRPDHFMTYALNAELLHRFGAEANVLRLLNRAVDLQEIPQQDVANLSTERQRVVQTVSRLSRVASFRQQVLFAYGNRCAVTRAQLRLVEAAHVLPVGAPGSVDHVTNGLALSPTYHKAFDHGLIYLTEDHHMRINEGQLHVLSRLNLTGGLDGFRATLGRVFLPPDQRQWPSVDFIRKANQFRQIASK